jgi:hypothetical protein
MGLSTTGLELLLVVQKYRGANTLSDPRRVEEAMCRRVQAGLRGNHGSITTIHLRPATFITDDPASDNLRTLQLCCSTHRLWWSPWIASIPDSCSEWRTGIH